MPYNRAVESIKTDCKLFGHTFTTRTVKYFFLKDKKIKRKNNEIII